MAKKVRLKMPVSDEANALLSANPFALLVGMVLDQQIPLEKAFVSPLELQHRRGRTLDAHDIAELDPDVLTELFCRFPALHRFPAANAERVQKMAYIIVNEYGGKADKLWKTAKTGQQLLKRVEALPGFGTQKAKIFVALLGKQFGVTPDQWQDACTPFGDEGTSMSIADITDDATLQSVRAWKAAKKAAAKAAAEKQ